MIITHFIARTADSDCLRASQLPRVLHPCTPPTEHPVQTLQALPVSRTFLFALASVSDPGSLFALDSRPIDHCENVACCSLQSIGGYNEVFRGSISFSLSVSGSSNTLSTLNSRCYLHAFKTRFQAAGLALPERDLHPHEMCACRRT